MSNDTNGNGNDLTTTRPDDFCDVCPHRKTCTLQFDESERGNCPMLNGEDEPLYYHNHEGYADPTAFLALRNAVNEDKHTNGNGKHTNNMDKHTNNVDKHTPRKATKPRKKKKYHKVQVIRYN